MEVCHQKIYLEWELTTVSIKMNSDNTKNKDKVVNCQILRRIKRFLKHKMICWIIWTTEKKRKSMKICSNLFLKHQRRHLNQVRRKQMSLLIKFKRLHRRNHKPIQIIILIVIVNKSPFFNTLEQREMKNSMKNNN